MADHGDRGGSSGARRAVSVTPHDTNELADIPSAVYVGGAGTLVVRMVEDSGNVSLVGVTAGSTLNIRPKLILSTGTTATSIVALYNW